ncbi:UBN2_3 domain-containing protein [Cucumis melo var. makuwa]|uniref:UBN2_3 domain-containing protein n=1 Tax=Cucumis melo var. makuwa TaxID=1194695 RepID=A0A5D3DT69_CUCMM|nr:UBN2_3 domain-containing protein [Cucumis melo var. makuwa]
MPGSALPWMSGYGVFRTQRPAFLPSSGNQQPATFSYTAARTYTFTISTTAHAAVRTCQPPTLVQSSAVGVIVSPPAGLAANPSCCPQVGNPTHSTFEQIAVIEAMLEASSNNYLTSPLYSENPRNCLEISQRWHTLRIEEVDMIYVFVAGLNPKFGIIRRRILNQRPIPSLMDVCYECDVPSHDNEKHNGKPIPICEHCEEQWDTKEQHWKLHGRPPGGKKCPSNDKQDTGRAYMSESASPSQLPGDLNSTTLGATAQSSIPQSFSLISVDGKNPGCWTLAPLIRTGSS